MYFTLCDTLPLPSVNHTFFLFPLLLSFVSVNFYFIYFLFETINSIYKTHPSSPVKHKPVLSALWGF